MVKKSIIAIALIGMLATVSYAQDTQVPGQLKIDGKWPVTCTYNPIVICRIPIVINIGMFIEIIDCSKKKIILNQVTCPSGQSFPCYKGCTTLSVRANFEAKLTLKLTKSGSIISSSWAGDNWKAYFRADALDGGQAATWIILGNGNTQKVDVCVEAWDTNIFAGTPTTDHTTFDGNGNVNHTGDEPTVGEVAISAIPTALPLCN